MTASRAPGDRTVGSAIRGAFTAAPGDTARFLLWTAVSSTPSFLHGFATAHALDDGFLVGDRSTGLAWLALIGVGIGIGAIGSWRMILSVAALVERFRDDLLGTVVRSSLTRSMRQGFGQDATAVARVAQQIEVVRVTLMAASVVVASFVISTGSALLGISALSTDMLVYALPPVVVALTVFAFSLPALLRRQRDYLLGGEQISGDLLNAIGGLRDVRACGAARQVNAQIGQRIETQARTARAIAGLTASRALIVGFGAGLPAALILLATPGLLRDGATPGEVIGSLTYVMAIVGAQLSAITGGIAVNGLTLWVTLGRLIDTSRGEPESRVAALAPGQVDAAVELRSVTFAYGPAAAPVIRDLSLTVPLGGHLAIVGPSGIGKSTLAGLVCGTMRPSAGQIRVFGTDIAAEDLARRSLFRVLIPQEAYVFTATLRENLAYLRPDVTDGELDRAVAAIGSTGLRDRLGGYAGIVQPTLLSAGERQLVALTRAYLSPANLVVLDEATCHLDPVAEAVVEAAFAARGGSLLVIAHRMSSALRADRILVLDGDRPLIGTHDQLLEHSALYRDLAGHWTASNVR